MRLLIVGTLKGQLTAASKLAMEKGASVTHAESIEHRPGRFAAGQHQIRGVVDDPGGDLGQGVHQTVCVLRGDRTLDGDGDGRRGRQTGRSRPLATGVFWREA